MQDDFSSNNNRAIQIGKDLAKLKIQKLEDDYDAALMALNIAKKENSRYREALEKSCTCESSGIYAMPNGYVCPACEALKGE